MAALNDYRRDQMAFSARQDWNRRDPCLSETERLVALYAAPYPDGQRRAWIARRVRQWAAGRR